MRNGWICFAEKVEPLEYSHLHKTLSRAADRDAERRMSGVLASTSAASATETGRASGLRRTRKSRDVSLAGERAELRLNLNPSGAGKTGREGDTASAKPF